MHRLQIIPVLDIRDGIVVQANGQDRDAYPPLRSVITHQNVVETVVADIMQWYAFSCIYIADLDALMGRNKQHNLIKTICQTYPDLQVWLDAGIKSASDLLPYQETDNLYHVLGSETLDDLSLLSSGATKHQFILSLDFRDQHFLGNKQLIEDPQLWPESMIVMSLDHVGHQQGPALDMFKALKTKSSKQHDWYLAGGIRDEEDLELVAEQDANGVLIATALHRGELSQKLISAWQKE